MLHKCANPACSNVFRRLSDGKLFQVETENFDPLGPPSGRNPRHLRKVEHFWLCDACSPFLTLAFDSGRGMMTVPLPEATGRKTVSPISLKDVRSEGGLPQALSVG